MARYFIYSSISLILDRVTFVIDILRSSYMSTFDTLSRGLLASFSVVACVIVLS